MGTSTEGNKNKTASLSHEDEVLKFKSFQMKNFMAGEWAFCSQNPVPLMDPSNGEFLTHQPQSSDQAIERALKSAWECHQNGEWYHLGRKRSDYLKAIASHLEPLVAQIATIESINTGVLHRQTENLVRMLPHVFREAARQLELNPDVVTFPPSHPPPDGRGIEMHYKPWGPALCLAPWNAPAMIGAHKLASALAAGAPTILKPSEWTPFSAQILFEAIAKAELPPGAAQLIHGGRREGAKLLNDHRIRAVSFTGGEEGGLYVANQCLPTLKRFQLELGGHNPFVVLPDGDFDLVMDSLISGLTTLNGQWCRAVGRVYLPKSWYSPFVEAFSKISRELNLGPPLDPLSSMGPIIHRAHKAKLMTGALELMEKGAQVIGTIDSQDHCYLRPFLLHTSAPFDNQKELFGPIATLTLYEDHLDIEDILRVMGPSVYGLAGYVFGKDAEKTYELSRRMEVGSVKINGVSLTSLLPSAPRCAWGLSGFGDEGGFATFRFFQGSSIIGRVSP